MSTRLWLARHGATDWSDAGRLNGWTDVPLNERGRLQARSLAERLAGRQFAAVWSSDLMRAIETARLAVGEPVPDGRLRELGFGSLEGQRWEECPPGVRKALAAFDGFEAPEGESVTQLCRRVHDFVEGLPDGGHLVFTHGGVIRLLLREGGHEARVAPGGLVEWRGRTERSTPAEGCAKGQAVSGAASSFAEENRRNPVNEPSPCEKGEGVGGHPGEGGSGPGKGVGSPGGPTQVPASGAARHGTHGPPG